MIRFRRRTITAPGGHTWREVPLTEYEADLLQKLAGEHPPGSWRAMLLAQIADRFRHGERSRLRVR